MAQAKFTIREAIEECEDMADSYRCLVEHLGYSEEFNRQQYEKYSTWARWFRALEQAKKDEFNNTLDDIMDQVNKVKEKQSEED